ncbi:hypothetical protein J3Q64DRAFT_1852744 [Phycomyces blakesleeanus]|uniref:Uncharacterized protein n=2 Tax=Phycomyces blakesleeanus TaxID=4837 RepID=A0A167L8Y8_PHYB8|nr:hypothetical protein PHYBLDRAFT_149041 [Phycomyces blakesleeanus NRRL 1555(-)]OAD69859.1 hypothetical protein PHYBLDRAFT_149041 [Phycomyces blakesleeanus NRRL 1555(-)]|eukprot:XP_018287899.1 hypothetical protein PHYBLDRAFT_149041 [Phycomyces blakesleeanus NRRL 1555(-)]
MLNQVDSAYDLRSVPDKQIDALEIFCAFIFRVKEQLPKRWGQESEFLFLAVIQTHLLVCSFCHGALVNGTVNRM